MCTLLPTSAMPSLSCCLLVLFLKVWIPTCHSEPMVIHSLEYDPLFVDRNNVTRFMVDQLSIIEPGRYAPKNEFYSTENVSYSVEEELKEAMEASFAGEESVFNSTDFILSIQSINVDLLAAAVKVSGVKSCKKNVDRAIQLSENLLRDLPHTQLTNCKALTSLSTSVRLARSHLSVCLALLVHGGIRGAQRAVYHGQAEMKSAEEKLKTVLHYLMQMVSSSPPWKASQTSSAVVPLEQKTVFKQGSRVESFANNYFLLFNGTTRKGSRVGSISTFESGMFSVKLRCPKRGNSTGLNTAFFLATSPDHWHRSSIILEFNSYNRSIVSLSTIKNGVSGWSSLVTLGYDCADGYHTYSIEWTPTNIIWRNERRVLRMIDLSVWEELFPRDAMRLYMSLALTNTVGLNSWVPYLPSWGVDYAASFLRVKVQSPLSGVEAIQPMPPHSPLSPLAVDYCMDHITIGRNEVAISFDSSGCGGRFRSTQNFMYGQFSARIKCPSGDASGLVSTFYLSTMEGDPSRDEVDFEFLGNSNSRVQTNLYVKGVGKREMVIDLGFDCSADFHTYTIRYTKHSLVWFVDGEKRRQYFAAHEKWYPSTPMFLYGSLWNGSGLLGGKWSGKWAGSDAPYIVQYQNFEVNSPWTGSQ